MAVNSLPVTLKDITKIFIDPHSKSKVLAVDNISIKINAGELVTLLGPSGCGKTTTLRMVAGFELPTEGKIFVGDNEITMLMPNQRDTAMVFQSYGLFPHMTVAQNVGYGLKIRKMSKSTIAERVNKILDLVGLANLGDRPPARLSGGQQQRVALARALVVEPSVLLLDEPLSNLDALLREQMRIEIRRIQKTLGITAIYVTHDRIEAMSLSDRIIVMNKGKIAQVGSPSDVYINPTSEFVAGFIGKATFFPVEIDSVVSGVAKVFLDGKQINIKRGADEVADAKEGKVLTRPESLKLVEKGTGQITGTVKYNVYLGNTVESYIETKFGELMCQIDNPAINKIYNEGEEVDIEIKPEISKLFAS